MTWNGIIRDGEKGGNTLRVIDGAVQVQLVGGVPPITGLTEGEVVFGSPSGVSEQDPELFWDNTAKQLGINTQTLFAPLSFGANFGLPSTEDGRKINLFDGNAHYSIGLDGGTVWITSQIYIEFWRKDVGPVNLRRVRFDLGNDRYLFGTDPTVDSGCTLQASGPSDVQFSVNAPTGQQFTTVRLLNNSNLVGFFSHDNSNAFNMLGYESTRLIMWDDLAVIIGVNQNKPNPDEKAVLQLIGDGQQGLTVPRVTTTNRNAMETAMGGLGIVGGSIIYDTDTLKHYGFDGTVFQAMY